MLAPDTLTAFDLQMRIAILTATISETLRRLEEKGGDSERALRRVVEMLESG